MGHRRCRVPEPGHRGVPGEERLCDEPRIQRITIDEHDGGSHDGHMTSQRPPMRPSSSSDRIAPRNQLTHDLQALGGLEAPQAPELGGRQAHAGHLAILAGDGTEQVVAPGDGLARDGAGVSSHVEVLSMGEARRANHASTPPLQRLCHDRGHATRAFRGWLRVTSAEIFAAIGTFFRAGGGAIATAGRRNGHASCRVVRREVCTVSRFHTIVVAVDFSDSTPDALETALALASIEAGSHVHLLHVVPSAMPPLWTDEPPMLELRTVEQAWADGALKQLTTLAAGQQLDPAKVTTAVAVGAPANEIVRYAEEHYADVVVLGSHGHGVVRRFLLGSVADKLVRQAPCAVLVVAHRTLRQPAPAPAASQPALP